MKCSAIWIPKARATTACLEAGSEANSNGRGVSGRNLARRTLTPSTLTPSTLTPWPRLRDRNSMADTILKLGRERKTVTCYQNFSNICRRVVTELLACSGWPIGARRWRLRSELGEPGADHRAAPVDESRTVGRSVAPNARDQRVPPFRSEFVRVQHEPALH